MSPSRTFATLGVAIGVLLAACGGSTGPSASATAVQPIQSHPNESAPAATAVAPPDPSPSSSATPAGDAGRWVTAGELTEARNATSAVVVGTGEILVVGSDYQTSWMSTCGASTDGSDSVEVGDLESGTWKKTTSLSSPRDAPVVVALPDGRALMTGGAAGESIGWSAFSSTYTFDPATHRWLRTGLLNTARTAAASAVLPDERVLVAGGLFMDRDSSEQGRALDSAELWDPRSGTWTRTRPLAERRFSASAVAMADGRVLLVGGAGSREDDPHALASAEVFDPVAGTWTSAGMLATARRGFALVALPEGGAIVAGGVVYAPGYASVSTVERFDPVSNAWAPAADLPLAVAGAAAIQLHDGRVLLAGGADTSDTALATAASLFDPESNRWTSTASLPVPRAGASPLLMPDGSVVLVGGSISGGEPDSTPGCPESDATVLRYVPGT